MNAVAAAAQALGSDVRTATAITGGDLNAAHRLDLADGRRVFVKSAPDALPGTFAAEAAALRWITAAEGALPTPAPLAHGECFLALEWVDEEPRGADYWEMLGRGLAALHGAGAPAFGATAPATPTVDDGLAPPTRLGPLLLANDPAPDWPVFYAQRRLLPLARRAHDAGALPAGTAAAIERVCARLPDLCGPPEPPARLHGDLWTGNVMSGPGGAPWLVDPAAFGGHREIDLAMLRLFGSPPPSCFDAYGEAHPLAPGADERVALNQLLPLLVHAVLFGGGYGGAVARAAAQYA